MSNFNVDENRLVEYAIRAKDLCLTNGLICIENDQNSIKTHDTAYPAPVTLFPTKFPKKQFDFAIEIQKYFNELVHDISNDTAFLKEMLNNVINVDYFTSKLWDIYEIVAAEGIAQPITMNILRNDFMLDDNKKDKDVCLSQIEINTVAVSFGAACSKVTNLHTNILNYTNNQDFIPKQPVNDNVTVLAKGIIEAWKLYKNKSAIVAFLVSDNERNIGDQRLLEFKCNELEKSLIIKRFTLEQIHKKGNLVDKRLIVDGDEIGLVYFRSGYTATDYKTNSDWDARLLIEKSFAIKSPNILNQLTGAKRIQQALCEPEIIQRFIKDKDVSDKLRSTFVDQYCFESNNFEDMVKFMLDNCQNYVLKPQREGGGNNIYREDIKEFYESLENKHELFGYILMKIVNPSVAENYLITTKKSCYKKENLISELGIFGVTISNGDALVHNETGGYLVRTKSVEVNEGGVATGYAALDSVYLV